MCFWKIGLGRSRPRGSGRGGRQFPKPSVLALRGLGGRPRTTQKKALQAQLGLCIFTPLGPLLSLRLPNSVKNSYAAKTRLWCFAPHFSAAAVFISRRVCSPKYVLCVPQAARKWLRVFQKWWFVAPRQAFQSTFAF